MNTCDTCKHWEQGKHFYDHAPLPSEDQGPLGNCLSEKFIRGYDADDGDALPDGVRVEDDEGWGFQTAPKFGCVHWQNRPEPGE